ncbi:UpxY family transcription antiterminator [Pedobacter cryoconitis]|uniref:Transcription antitermination factor NusG n=1 Tax=Pedobacter cryoconitis TaxID=188932 RepID=A0A7X0J7J9_9SPHI|nr:UpxY family transcription antiterminator [Pedobacter cryoconitis]MBB6501297.1 transcription antitermination factor NusG [Pedobacter cryoconitis]
MNKNFVPGWYVLYTKTNNEKKVALTLSENNINHYLPLVKVLRNWNDRKKLVELPMFPSYLFIYLTGVKDYIQGLEIGGVINYVRFGKQIAMVDDLIINSLKIMTNASASLEISSEGFQFGQRLLIKEGMLTGLYCELVQYKGKEKLLVRIDLLNRNILMDMPLDFVTKIHSEYQGDGGHSKRTIPTMQ